MEMKIPALDRIQQNRLHQLQLQQAWLSILNPTSMAAANARAKQLHMINAEIDALFMNQ